MAGRLAILFIVALATFELGIVTNVPSRVRMRVLLNPTDSTAPSVPSTVTRSPTWKGRSANRAIDPKKLDNVSWAARAIARPPIPRPVRRLTTL